MNPRLENFSFLTPETLLQKPNVYAGLVGADLTGISNTLQKRGLFTPQCYCLLQEQGA